MKNKKSKKQLDKGYVIQKLAHYHKPYIGFLLIVFVLMLMSNSFVLVGPYLSGLAIDAISELSNGGEFGQIPIICGIMIIFYIISSILSFIIYRIMIHIGKNISKTLRTEVQDHLIDLPISYYDTKHSGDIISCMSYDISVLNTSLTNDIIQIGNSIITLVFSFIMMFTISPTLLCVLSITTIATILLAKHRLTYTKPLFRERSRKLGLLNG